MDGAVRAGEAAAAQVAGRLQADSDSAHQPAAPAAQAAAGAGAEAGAVAVEDVYGWPAEAAAFLHPAAGVAGGGWRALSWGALGAALGALGLAVGLALWQADWQQHSGTRA